MNANTSVQTVSIQNVSTQKIIEGENTAEEVFQPTLRDVYSLIQRCSSSLSLLTGQVQAIQEEVIHICGDLQNVHERTKALESGLEARDVSSVGNRDEVCYT